MSWVRTTCPYCGVGCGLLARQSAQGAEVVGDAEHPANFGRTCSKGAALAETVGLEGRLLRPRVDGQDAEWTQALDAAAARFTDIIHRHGPDAVAFYVSGQLLTEDYYVANKLMKGFIGSANIDTNSRLCMSSAVAAHKRAFGEDLVPVQYEDLELADLVVLVGSNLAWCHPVLYQRLISAKTTRPQMRIVVIDPRSTATCEYADLHLPLRSGTDVLLFNGLLSWLAQVGAVDRGFVEAHTRGAARALLLAHNTAGDPDALAKLCGLAPADVRRFFEWFAGTERVVSVFSQGVNQSSAGTDKANSIINAHLLTGRIGQPGMGPFSVTGQPNAMGGREVGGLSNMLAAHMELEDAASRSAVQRFWDAPRMASRPGLKAVELFEAIYQGQVKAVWIIATNPVVSLPNADRARAALKRCELVVVSECVADTDTAGLAHILFPASAWGEKDGTVTNSERQISRQRSFLSTPGDARPDWWILCQIAQRMGFAQQFDYTSSAQIFNEHARLSALNEGTSRQFNIGALAEGNAASYEAMAPIRWPIATSRDPVPLRLFSDGRFAHPDGRARFIAVRPQPPKFSLDAEFPLVLNTGRIRDQWHTMTRTGRSVRLAAHLPEPFVDLHPLDAHAFGLRESYLGRIETRWGAMVARVRCSGELPRGALFVPIHWNDSNASAARVGALVSPSVDALSGEPEFKNTPARIAPFLVNWFGFAIARRDIKTQGLSWWSRAKGQECHRYEFAGRSVPVRWEHWARSLLGADVAADWIDFEDVGGGTYRAAWIREDVIEACVFVGPRPQLPPRDWLLSLFAQAPLSISDRACFLAGTPAGARIPQGAIVCACYSVGRNALCAAVESGCRDTHALGRMLKAGTNCGSCLPELRRIIADHSHSAASDEAQLRRSVAEPV